MFPVALPVFATLLSLGGCLPEGPLFAGITKVKAKQVTVDGTKTVDFGDVIIRKVANCLYQSVEVSSGDAAENLLPEVYLVDVTDNAGTRTFELYTRENLKGNKGKYYRNRCLYGLIQEWEEQKELEDMAGGSRRR